MRFLADMGVSTTTLVALRQNGHDVEHLSELGLHQMEDQDIVSRAKAQERVVLTFDLDFGEIMALAGSSRPSVILFRMRNQTPPVVTERLLHTIQHYSAEVASGAFVTIEDFGCRIRRLPLR